MVTGYGLKDGEILIGIKMTNKVWKQRERQVAKFFGTHRTPLSGGASRHTRSDTLHKKIFVECKYRKKHAVIKLWNETNEMAKKEKKTPVVALCEHGKPGFWVMMHSADLKNIATYICKLLEDNDDSKYLEKK